MVPLEIKKQELATIAVAASANTNANESIDKVNKNNKYKEDNEPINPFVMGIEIWQNYYAFWIDYCKDMLNYNARMKDFGNSNEKSWKYSTKAKGFIVKAE